METTEGMRSEGNGVEGSRGQGDGQRDVSTKRQGLGTVGWITRKREASNGSIKIRFFNSISIFKIHRGDWGKPQER
jgi:hypothetical protein